LSPTPKALAACDRMVQRGYVRGFAGTRRGFLLDGPRPELALDIRNLTESASSRELMIARCLLERAPRRERVPSLGQVRSI
jgi:hypothetical protein